MGVPFIGSEAVASGVLVKSALRTQYTKLFRDVYVSPDTELTPQLRAYAGWLWSRRRGIIAGLSASALHGAKWVDVTAPLEIIHSNRNRLPGIQVRGEGIREDEVGVIEGIPSTNPARTALDLGCWYPKSEAVAAIDSLARATGLKMLDMDLLALRYPGRRGYRSSTDSAAPCRRGSAVAKGDLASSTAD